MTNPDYRAMCAELVDALENARRIIDGADGTLHINTAEFVLRRARTLLAQPTPQPVAVAPYREVADLVVWLEDHSAECLELDQPEWSKSINQAARFLHLYLRATPQPVAVSERLPRPEDCDEKGRCWWHRYTPTKEWHLQRVYIGRYNYWLPANALPTPEAT